MPRLTSARPRKRRRCYEVSVLLRRRAMTADPVRIRPLKRIFRTSTPFHL